MGRNKNLPIYLNIDSDPNTTWVARFYADNKSTELLITIHPKKLSQSPYDLLQDLDFIFPKDKYTIVYITDSRYTHQKLGVNIYRK